MPPAIDLIYIVEKHKTFITINCRRSRPSGEESVCADGAVSLREEGNPGWDNPGSDRDLNVQV